jgi:hypothetical protein
MNYIPSQFVIYKNQENLYFFLTNLNNKLQQQQQQQQQPPPPSLIPLSGVGYIDQITP